MKRKKIVAGNWKMNLTMAEAMDLANAACAKLNAISNEVDVIMIPSFPFITEINKIVTPQNNVFVGAQNCYTQPKGAYTGEVSASMIASVGCKYLLVGHSERRLYFKETNEELVLKIKEALANNLKPIFCIGETLEERKLHNHFTTIETQLKNVLSHFTEEEFTKFIIAYEPVWAIGTGETATTEQAQEMHAFIRNVISKLFNFNSAQQTSILYGGSCNAQNAQTLFACADVDGGLIGGAALKADDFCAIVNSF